MGCAGLLLLVDLVEVAYIDKLPVFTHVVLFFEILFLSVIEGSLEILRVVLLSKFR